MSSQTSENGAAQGKEKCIIIIIISKGERAKVGSKELDTNPGIICGYCWLLAAGHQIELTLQQINKCMAAAIIAITAKD
jgi:hypothetical protein